MKWISLSVRNVLFAFLGNFWLKAVNNEITLTSEKWRSSHQLWMWWFLYICGRIIHLYMTPIVKSVENNSIWINSLIIYRQAPPHVFIEGRKLFLQFINILLFSNYSFTTSPEFYCLFSNKQPGWAAVTTPPVLEIVSVRCTLQTVCHQSHLYQKE